MTASSTVAATVPVAPAGLEAVIGRLPYRLQMAGGWIDQPFVSALDPDPPGSMVVVSLRPTVRYLDRCGMATGTRVAAKALWGDALPLDRPPADLVRELYAAENAGRAEPSGSQDMCGLIYPGISRLDYDASIDGGWFPAHVESTSDPTVVAWLERVIHLVPVGERPPGYGPLGVKRLEPAWIARLGASGRACYDAILAMDVDALGASLNECSLAWDAILPQVFEHPTIKIDLRALRAAYAAEYPGAMFSGCGGGYLIVASNEPPAWLRSHLRALVTTDVAERPWTTEGWPGRPWSWRRAWTICARTTCASSRRRHGWARCTSVSRPTTWSRRPRGPRPPSLPSSASSWPSRCAGWSVPRSWSGLWPVSCTRWLRMAPHSWSAQDPMMPTSCWRPRPTALAAGVPCHIVWPTDRAGFPVTDPAPPPPDVPRVVVTGCYDWLHSGHVRFFMDAAAFGALYAVVGSDRNVSLLKGPGHPMQREAERRYMVGAVRSVHRCMVSTGSGWMDAEPEIAEIGPAFYVVNEDGDQPEKREFCRTHGIEYVVLARVPHAGLPARSSTELRGF